MTSHPTLTALHAIYTAGEMTFFYVECGVWDGRRTQRNVVFASEQLTSTRRTSVFTRMELSSASVHSKVFQTKQTNGFEKVTTHDRFAVDAPVNVPCSMILP